MYDVGFEEFRAPPPRTSASEPVWPIYSNLLARPLRARLTMAQRRNVALIIGISGQDGAYLSRFLLNRGYTVHGTSRDKEMSSFTNLHKLDIHSRISLHSAAVQDFRSVVQVIDRI